MGDYRLYFVTVMKDKRLTDAISADEHFRQAGFRALLLDIQ